MILFKEEVRITDFLSKAKQEQKKISLVPTMGALHQGHLSLLDEAKNQGDLAVCSIFVNPTQFNNATDFEKYPSTIEMDINQLEAAECDVLFLPSELEIYPAGYNAPVFDLGILETILEGFYRPGHFQGVCQVVDRLLEVIKPDSLVLGRKDLQQCKVIERLLSLTGRTNVNLLISPTIRENDGLAMSSRNLRLNPAQRKKAGLLYSSLKKAGHDIDALPLEKIRSEAITYLQSNGFKIDYFDIVDTETLLPPEKNSEGKVAVVAAYLDDIRLIDNLRIR